MPPLTLMVKPASGLCDMRCRYCFYADEMRNRTVPSYGLMSAETLDALLRRAYSYADDTIDLAFQGGEPTLAGKDFYRKLLRMERSYAHRDVSVRHSIQTNGLTLDKEWMDIFRAGNFLVGVSLDGTQAAHDANRRDAQDRPTWARVDRSLQLLQKSNIEYNVLCVVTRQAAQDPQAVFHALKKHGFLQFIPCLDPLDGSAGCSPTPEDYGRFLIETFDLFEAAYRRSRPVSVRHFDSWLNMVMGMEPDSCAMSGRCGDYFVVEADGSVFPCDFYALDEWNLGSIHEQTFFQLAKSPLRQSFIQRSFAVSEDCLSCKWHHLCRGGCPRDRVALSESAGKTRWCISHRMFFEARLKQLEKMGRDIMRVFQ